MSEGGTVPIPASSVVGHAARSMVPVSVLFLTADAAAIAVAYRVVVGLGGKLHVAGSIQQAARVLGQHPCDVLVVQAEGELTESPALFEGLRSLEPSLPIVAVSVNGSIAAAVSAMRAGASDYVPALVSSEQALGNALRTAVLEGSARGRPALAQAGECMPVPGFLTVDRRMLGVCRLAAALADGDMPLLIEGEPGTGKSLLAQKLHEVSSRHLAPFVEVDCAALTDGQAAAELFADGEAAGRTGDGRGALAGAHGGSLLLSNVAHLSPPLLRRLLAAVEARGLQHRSDGRALRADVRLLVAGRGRLSEEAGGSLLEAALGERHNAVRVELPPLRQRVADVPVLARHFARLVAAERGRRATPLSAGAVGALVRYHWPGNVRELSDAVQSAVLAATQDAVLPTDLPEGVRQAVAAGPSPFSQEQLLPLKEAMRKWERQFIAQTLRWCDGNRRRAARRLQIGRSTLYKKTRAYGLDRLSA